MYCCRIIMLSSLVLCNSLKVGSGATVYSLDAPLLGPATRGLLLCMLQYSTYV